MLWHAPCLFLQQKLFSFLLRFMAGNIRIFTQTEINFY